MKNLLAEAMARVIVEGLTAHSAHMEKLTRELEFAIIQAAQASGKPVTIETLFAGQHLNGPAFADLRKILRNPGLKPEATISELRRAEGYFIRAHDEYIAKYSDDRANALRWAELRLAIARLSYDEMIRSLPTASRPQARPKAERSTSVIGFEMDAFSADEQKALRQAILDREDAIRQLETIIRRGDATSDTTHLICSYLRDPNKIEQVNRWLTAEQSKARTGISEIDADTKPVAHMAQPSSVGAIVADVAMDDGWWPPRLETPRAKPDAAHKLIGWLKGGPIKLLPLYVRTAAGDIRLRERPRSTPIASLFEGALDHPQVQEELAAICAEHGV
ncbi:MAG: hypothetical protein WBF65_09900 [Sphingopyxis granuli]|uniref:hypothetical protein n=1 Tax=Sphingopyxis granuli TaxID=267128 RepID=UPI003C74A550